MSGGGGGGTNTVQKADPWKGQQPYLTDIFEKAQANYNAPGPEFFPDATYVPYTDLERAGQAGALQFGVTGAQQQADDAAAAQQFQLRDALYPQSNPAIRQAAQGAIDPIAERLQEQILPQIDQGAVLSGAYGGSRHGIAQAQAIDKSVEDMLNTTAGIYSDAYGRGLDAQTKALALAPQTLSLGLQPSSIVSGVGQMDRTLQEAMLQDAMARHQFDESLESAKLAEYQNLIQGNYGGTSRTSTTGSSNTLSSALGGGMLGYGLGSWLGGTALGGSLASSMGIGASAFGPIGAGIGALISFL